MGAKTCVDCGTVLNGGICSNCQEELYILTYQTDGFDEGHVVSDEFAAKAEEQREQVENAKRQ